MRIGLQDGWKVSFQGIQGANTWAKPVSYVKEGVCLPHTVVETPYDYFDESMYQGVAVYSKTVVLPDHLKDKIITFVVSGAAHRATIKINGEVMNVSRCGYTACRTNLTNVVHRLITEGDHKLNIEIEVDSRENLDQPPFGGTIDYMTYGGIYRGVFMDVRPYTSIRDVFNRSNIINGSSADVSMDVTVSDYSGIMQAGVPLKLEAMLTTSGGRVLQNIGCEIAGEPTPIPIKGFNGFTRLYKCNFRVEEVEAWSPENPFLYNLTFTLTNENTNEQLDSFTYRLGIRTIEWKADGFYLNGKRYQIRGLNRHQSYPYVGYAMPETIEKRDAKILKEELGLNAVRTSHYPQSHAFLNACDELGLLVFTEVPGWQHIGESEEWRNQFLENVKTMIGQYRHHPSIVLWGVRVNESMDDDELYKKANEIAHEMAPGCYTGGVRYLRQSHLFEDVYTYNDFLYNGDSKPCAAKREVTPDMKKAYIVTEYNGHMFPTKPWDDEDHLKEQIIRHAKVLNAIMGEPGIAGSFGWCAFDYNTHKEFGAGDRVCYHGVCDMFRNPKPAAYLYKSQSDAAKVFHVTSAMDIGEHPGGYLDNVYVLTNADSVRLYKNEEFIKEFYPDKRDYRYLPHPPVIVDDFIGDMMVKKEGISQKTSEKLKRIFKAISKYGQNSLPGSTKLMAFRLMKTEKFTVEKIAELYGKYAGGWGKEGNEYRFVATRAGSEAEEIIKSPVTDIALSLDIDRTRLNSGRANGIGVGEWFGNTAGAGAKIGVYDVAAIRYRVVDQNGNTLRNLNDGVALKCKGSIELIGPEVSALRGGMGGTYVRTIDSGEGTLSISYHGMSEVVKFDVD